MCRSSTYAKAGGLKNDPRPVSDKAYQANCIKSLIAYLSTHGYDQALTPKMLSNPMGKDVMHILQFLMHQVRLAHASASCVLLRRSQDYIGHHADTASMTITYTAKELPVSHAGALERSG